MKHREGKVNTSERQAGGREAIAEAADDGFEVCP
jgi:hypothetical protein